MELNLILRIIIIDAAWYGGGAETIARELYKYLNEAGHDVKFVFARGDIPEDVNGIRLGSTIDVLLNVAHARLFDSAGFGFRKMTDRLINLIEKFNPDIVSMHNLSGYYLNIKVLFSYLKKKNIPVAWTFHDCWAFTGHCISFDDVKCKKWLTGCGMCPARKEYPASYLFDNSKKNYLKKKELLNDWERLYIVTPSQWMADITSKTFLKNKEMYVINNGINLDVFKPSESQLRENYKLCEKTILLSIASNWSYRKGLHHLIELNKLLDHDKYQLVIIGLSKKQISSMPPDIIAIQRTNTVEELVYWYTVADIMLYPSLADNFPTVILESLACGTPVVTFDTGGCWEAVGDECGVLVNEKTPEGLYKGIIDCYKKKIAPASCVKKSQNYDRLIKFKEYENLFIKMQAI